MIEGMLARAPNVVVIRMTRRASDCERGLGRVLLQRGYVMRCKTLGAAVLQRVAPASPG